MGINGDKIEGRLEGIGSQYGEGMVQQGQGKRMVGIQVVNEQEERKDEEKKMIKKIKDFIVPSNAGEDFRGSDIDDMTYDISGSGFDDATSEMQLQLGGEERERGATI